QLPRLAGRSEVNTAGGPARGKSAQLRIRRMIASPDAQLCPESGAHGRLTHHHLRLALVIGVYIGLHGGGGAILAVPVLTYITGLEPVQAIPSSLLIVGVTSAVSLTLHALKKRVQWRTGIIFGFASMAGAFAGGRLGSSVPSAILMFSFAAVMIAAAVAMIRGRKGNGDEEESAKLPVVKIVITGAVVGLVSGFVGAGGGFLIVPALALLARLPM